MFRVQGLGWVEGLGLGVEDEGGFRFQRLGYKFFRV